MILTKNLISDAIAKEKSLEKKIIFTNGCFDIIHSGHVTYLNESKQLGDILVIGLNSDQSVRRLKGINRPINIQQDRAIVLDNLKAVDFVTIFDEDTPYNLISIIKPDIITKGGDYTKENVVGYDIVNKYGGKVVIINLVEGKSTTSIINKIM